MDAQLRHSLRWRLAALICGLCVVMLVVVLYAAYREVESTLEHAASDRARAAADQVATIFGNSGLQSFGQLQRVAPSASSYLREPTDAHLAALRSAVASLTPTPTRRITVWDAAGVRVFEAPRGSEPAGAAGLEPETRPAAPGISPLRPAGNRVFAEAGVPLRDESGAPLGSLTLRALISASPPDALNRLLAGRPVSCSAIAPAISGPTSPPSSPDPPSTSPATAAARTARLMVTLALAQSQDWQARRGSCGSSFRARPRSCARALFCGG